MNYKSLTDYINAVAKEVDEDFYTHNVSNGILKDSHSLLRHKHSGLTLMLIFSEHVQYWSTTGCSEDWVDLDLTDNEFVKETITGLLKYVDAK